MVSGGSVHIKKKLDGGGGGSETSGSGSRGAVIGSTNHTFLGQHSHGGDYSRPCAGCRGGEIGGGSSVPVVGRVQAAQVILSVRVPLALPFLVFWTEK